MNREKNIVLIGLMGAGKTTVGKLIANKLNFPFIDIDDEIEKKENIKIAQIFKEKGESYFRQLETAIIKEVSSLKSHVISTGGGAPVSQININNLKQNGIIFYLSSSIEVLYERLSNETGNRPLLYDNDPKIKLENLLKQRERYYLKADYTIKTDNKLPDYISNEIVSIFSGE